MHLFIRLKTFPHSIKLLAAALQEKGGNSGGHTMSGDIKTQRAPAMLASQIIMIRHLYFNWDCVYVPFLSIPVFFVCLALLCMFLEFTIQIFVKSEQKLGKKACRPIQPQID